MTPVKQAYFAGIIDGEGCITMTETKRANGLSTFSPKITAASTDYIVVEDLEKQFGGKIYPCSDKGGNSRQAWSWQLSGKEAMYAILEIYLYLRLKAERAKIALEWLWIRPVIKRGTSDSVEVRKMKREQSADIKARLTPLNKRGKT
jgi:hypothetical protein